MKGPCGQELENRVAVKKSLHLPARHKRKFILAFFAFDHIFAKISGHMMYGNKDRKEVKERTARREITQKFLLKPYNTTNHKHSKVADDIIIILKIRKGWRK